MPAGFCAGTKPSAEEIAQVEAAKAAIRAGHLASMRGMTLKTNSKKILVTEADREAERKRLAMTAEIIPDPGHNCPECGKPYPGLRRRCYDCKPAVGPGAHRPQGPAESRLGESLGGLGDLTPGRVRATEAAREFGERRAAAAPPMPPPPTPPPPRPPAVIPGDDPLDGMILELNAAKSILELIRGLPIASRRRVLQMLDSMLPGEGG